MSSFISVPREALSNLLQACGSTLTPEQYIASLSEVDDFRKYPGRARLAGWNKSIMVVIATLAVVLLPFMFGLENLIVTVGLAAAAFFECRVHRYFRENNFRAPILGFRNQSAFAAGILIYCLYHAIFPSPIEIPAYYSDVMDPSYPSLIAGFERIAYLLIGIVGGGSQFALAWYYRTAAISRT
jgi:hypothetical protein